MSLESDLNRVISHDGDTESLLEVMRHHGCSKIESIKLLMQLRKLPLREAKLVVHNSHAWQDVKESDEGFHERLAEHLDKFLG